LIITFTGYGNQKNNSTYATALVSAMCSLTKGTKTLVLQICEKDEESVEYLLTGVDDAAVFVDKGLTFTNEGVDGLLRQSDAVKLSKEDFDQMCLSLRQENRLDIAEMTKSTSFVQNLPQRISNVKQILRNAMEVYDNIFVLLPYSSEEVIKEINELEIVDRCVYCLKQEEKNKAFIYGAHPIILALDFDEDSMFTLRHIRRTLHLGKNVSVRKINYNTKAKDAACTCQLLGFLALNRDLKEEDINYRWSKDIRELLAELLDVSERQMEVDYEWEKLNPFVCLGAPVQEPKEFVIEENKPEEISVVDLMDNSEALAEESEAESSNEEVAVTGNSVEAEETVEPEAFVEEQEDEEEIVHFEANDMKENDGFEEITVSDNAVLDKPKKKKGFFARLFGKKTKEEKPEAEMAKTPIVEDMLASVDELIAMEEEIDIPEEVVPEEKPKKAKRKTSKKEETKDIVDEGEVAPKKKATKTSSKKKNEQEAEKASNKEVKKETSAPKTKSSSKTTKTKAVEEKAETKPAKKSSAKKSSAKSKAVEVKESAVEEKPVKKGKTTAKSTTKTVAKPTAKKKSVDAGKEKPSEEPKVTKKTTKTKKVAEEENTKKAEKPKTTKKKEK